LKVAPSIFVIFFNLSDQHGDQNFWVISTILIVASIPSLPLLLIFTIKQKKVDQISTQPPKKLQFHDDSVTSQEISNPLQFHENWDVSAISQPVTTTKDTCRNNLPNQVEDV
jgi:hypothetical protein